MIIDQAFKPMAKKASWVGSLYYLIYFVGAGSYMPFLFVYFTEMGLNGKQVGWLATLSPLMMLLLAMPVASLADRFQVRVRVAQLATAGICMIIFLLQFPRSFLGIALLMFGMAIFNSSNSSIAESLIARSAQRYRLSFGSIRLWGSFGFATSALVFGVIWQRLGFGSMFLVSSFLFLPLIWVLGNLEESLSLQQPKQASVMVLLRDRGLLILVLATFLAAISNSVSITFSGIYARSLGGGNFVIGLMIAVGAFSELPAMFYSERLARLLTTPYTIILSYILLALGFLGYIYTPSANLIPLFSILKGLGYGLWIPLTIRMITHRTPEQWAATAQSLISMSIFGLAPLVASPLGGWINDTFSAGAVFWLGIGTLGLAVLVLVAAVHRKIIE